MSGQWTALPSGHTKDSSLSKRKKGEEKVKRLRGIWQGDAGHAQPQSGTGDALPTGRHDDAGQPVLS